MTDDLRMGLARAMFRTVEGTDAGWDDAPAYARQHCRDLADAALSQFTAHLASEDMVETIGDAVFDPGKFAGVRGPDETMRQWTTRAVIAAQVAAMGEGHG